MLDGILVIFIAVAIPAYLIAWFVGNSRKKKSDREHEESREMTDRWMSVLSASGSEIMEAADLAEYHPSDDDDDVLEEFIPTPEKMAAYYFDTLGLAQDFRAIYGTDWRNKVRIAPDETAAGKYERPNAVWRVEGFKDSETMQIEKAITALLLSKKGKVRKASPSDVTLNIVVVPGDRKPWANRWFKRIEDNLRACGYDVDLYVCPKEYEGYKLGAFFAPGPYLAKLDEQEDVYGKI